MSMNSFGHLFRVTTWGESHGPALGATVDGCPPGVPVDEAMLQHWLDKRRPGQNKNTTQRNEPDAVKILSGVFDGKTTGTSIQLMIENTDQRSRDYGEISQTFRLRQIHFPIVERSQGKFTRLCYSHTWKTGKFLIEDIDNRFAPMKMKLNDVFPCK